MAFAPIDRPTLDEIEDEEAYRSKPQWIKFYYGAWLLSTSSWDADQQGWYIKLLTWAASEGDPAGYLPDDEEELKEIAGFKELNPAIALLLKRGASIPDNLMKEMEATREAKWQKVRRKFRPARTHPGYVYNKRLLAALLEAYRNTSLQRNHGRKGGEVTQAKVREEKEAAKQSEEQNESLNPQKRRFSKLSNKKRLEAGSQAGSESPSKASKALSLPLPSYSSLILDNRDNGSLVEGINLLEETEESRDITSNGISDELVLVPEEDENDSQDATKSSLNEEMPARARSRRQPETIFDEDKFVITVGMKSHLLTKYHDLEPQLDDGDFELLREKFCNVYHNTRHSSWSRTFYNFVSNQLIKYGYEPGAYKRLRRRGGLKPDVSTSGQAAPWESATDKRVRLEEEADEYTRQLRGGS